MQPDTTTIKVAIPTISQQQWASVAPASGVMAIDSDALSDKEDREAHDHRNG